MKKLLLSLFWIITLWLNFWYCDNVSSYIDDILLFSWTLNSSDSTSNFPTLFNYWDNWPWTYCINFVSIVRSDWSSIPNSTSVSLVLLIHHLILQINICFI